MCLEFRRVLFRRSEEHTSELQSHDNLVCRLLVEKKQGERGGAGRLREQGPRRERRRGRAARRCAAAPPPPPRAPPCLLARRCVCRSFFNDTATTEIYTLSLHDALPINDTATTEIYSLSLLDALPLSVVAVS